MVKKERKINRGVVHIVTNSQGSTLEVIEGGEFLLRLQQIEMWLEDSKMHTNTKESVITGKAKKILAMGNDDNHVPGNIRIIEQLEPPIPEDTEACIYYNEQDEIMRDDRGNVVYRYLLYISDEEYEPHKEIDTIII